MSKILILQQDLLHLDSVVSTGGALRARALGEGLAVRGHQIFYSVPREIFDLYTEEERELHALLWHSPGNMDYALKMSCPDIIILQWLGSYECLKCIRDIPIVIDMVAPRLFELYHRGRSLEGEIRSKAEALSLGDLFICSNQRQWYYFLPWLTLAGESDAGNLLKVVPVSAPLREPVKREKDETVFIWGGVRWPWNNPLSFLNIVSDEIKRSGKGRLVVLSGNFPYKYGGKTGFADWESKLDIHSGVELMPLLPYSKMADVYFSGSVAIDICADLPERRLASPFRTKDYLSCGLPLITADFMEISPYIKEYGAGWVVKNADTKAFRKVVRRLVDTPGLAGRPGDRARQLLSDHFTFERAVEPLDAFCRNPLRRKKKRSLLNISIRLGCAGRLVEMSSEREAPGVTEDEESLGDTESLHYIKGLAFMKKGDFKSAKREFLKEEELFPSKVQVLLKIYRIQLYEGLMPDTLIPKVENLLDQYPGEENTRFELALLCYLDSKAGMAETFFNEEILLFPRKVFKLYSMGSELKKRGFVSEPLCYFRRLLTKLPLNPDFEGGGHFHIGEIYLKRGERERAVRCFKMCVEILPGHRKAREHLTRLAKDGLQ